MYIGLKRNLRRNIQRSSELRAAHLCNEWNIGVTFLIRISNLQRAQYQERTWFSYEINVRRIASYVWIILRNLVAFTQLYVRSLDKTNEYAENNDELFNYFCTAFLLEYTDIFFIITIVTYRL